MEFGLAITLTNEIKKKSGIIQSLSDDLSSHFKDRYYGTDIKAYTIGIVCVSPQFSQFFKEKKPKYTRGKKIVSSGGVPILLEDNFEYSIKIDFESFKDADEQEARKILAKEILASLVVFEKLKSKIKDFDMDSFKEDLGQFFRNHGLI